jgi:hypothetical protein
VLCITNVAFDSRGVNTNTGTLSPEVRRVTVPSTPRPETVR